MTNANFASLHAGMLQRNVTASSYDGGKVVKTLPPSHLLEPKIDFQGAEAATPPIRSLLDRVADWTALPDQAGPGFGKRHDGPAVARPSPRAQAIEPARADPPVSGNPVSAHGPVPAAPSEGLNVAAAAPDKPKRKALTFRLERESHRRLHLASDSLGRTCQSILFSAMNRYLTSLGFEEIPESGD